MQRIEVLSDILKNDFSGGIIVFGAGNIGRKVYSYLKFKQKNVFITDNKKEAYCKLENAISVAQIKDVYSSSISSSIRVWCVWYAVRCVYKGWIKEACNSCGRSFAVAF